jgi:septal ring factor EnvC (AmiA/AmiB activator)
MQARSPQPRPLQRVSIAPPYSLGQAIVLALTAIAVVFLLAELNAMRVGMDSVNVAIAQTNTQLLRTNRQLGSTNRQLSGTNRQLTGVASLLHSTNRTLIVMENQLQGTNSRLGRTNEQLRTMGGNIAPMRTAIDGMTKKIVHAKLLF